MRRVDDTMTLSKDAVSGKVKGKENPNGGMGLKLVISDYGVRINHNKKAIK